MVLLKLLSRKTVFLPAENTKKKSKQQLATTGGLLTGHNKTVAKNEISRKINYRYSQALLKITSNCSEKLNIHKDFTEILSELSV
ncbi:MAG: hypothetical protein GX876_00820 [Bacteroidales bacterium]|nr:hypothetical protein [Bacteroidales bacterium]